MFGRTREEPSPQARVAGVTTRASEGGPPPASVGGRPGGGGPREGLVLALFAVLTLGAIALVLVLEERDAVRDPAEKAQRGEIGGFDDLSLLRAENLRRALAEVEESGYPLVTNVRVAADRLNVVARNDEGTRRVLVIDPGFGVDESDFGTGDDAAVPAGEVEAEAPDRIVRAVLRRTRLAPEDVDYVTLSVSRVTPSMWSLFLKAGPVTERHWIAEADGADVRRPGELSARDERANERADARARRELRRRQRLTERRVSCLQRARDAGAASRCLERFS
jgi:hypothetical protein